jgi:putative aldouronate transport system substrate-binding protein
MQKKLLSVGIVLALFLTMFSGCGGTSSSSSAASESTTIAVSSVEEPAEATEEPAETPAVESDVEAQESIAEEASASDELPAVELPLTDTPVTLSYFMAQANSFSNPLIEDQGKAFYFDALAEDTNVYLDTITATVSSASTEVALLIASGDIPDLIENANSYYSGGLPQLVADDVILVLDDYLDEYMPNYQALLESNELYMKSSVMDDGSIAMVYGFNEEGYLPEYGIAIRKDWLDGLGMDVSDVVTYDDYYEMLKAFQSEYGATAALYLPEGGFTMGNYFAAGYNTAGKTDLPPFPPFIQIDGVVEYGPANDGMYEYISMLNQWYSEGLIYQDFITTGSSMNQESEIDNTGCFVTSVGQWTSYWGTYSNDDSYELVGATSPVQNEGDELHIRFSSDLVLGEGVCISASCAYPELACAYMNYWYTDAGYLILNYGIEGETWEYDETGSPAYTDFVTNNPDGYTMSEITGAYTKTRGAFLVNWKRNMSTYDETQMEAMNAWAVSDNAYAIPSAATMNEEENAAYIEHYTDVQTIVQENLSKFITGDQPLNEETWAEYIAKLDNAGLSICISSKQSALDRYNSR